MHTQNFNDDPPVREVPPEVEYDNVTTLDGPGGSDPTHPHGTPPVAP